METKLELTKKQREAIEKCKKQMRTNIQNLKRERYPCDYSKGYLAGVEYVEKLLATKSKKEKKYRLVVSIDKATKMQLQNIAEKFGLSMADVIRRSVNHGKIFKL